MRRLFIVAVLLSGTGANVLAAEHQLLRIHGSNTIGAALLPKLVHAWLHSKDYTLVETKNIAHDESQLLALNPMGDEIVVEIHAHGSSTAFADFTQASTDIGMASRPIKAQELKNLASLGALDQAASEYVLALDGLAVIVHSTNSLQKLDKNSLRKIFTGKVTNWSQLGLPNGKIHVYARDHNSGTFDTFVSLVLGKSGALISDAQRFESNAELAEAVSRDPLGIGFVGVAYAGATKTLAIAENGAEPILPSSFNVATEDYALSRRLFLYVPAKTNNQLAQQFAHYAVSPAVQSIIDKLGFISQSIKMQPRQTGRHAPEEYQQLTKGAERLSLDIRFHASNGKLDNKAVRDVARLVEFMSSPENKQRQLMLFGFSDAKEVLPYAALSLSIERADAVADKLIRYGLEPIKVRGFGQALPVANNSNRDERHNNRRVEVWVK